MNTVCTVYTCIHPVYILYTVFMTEYGNMMHYGHRRAFGNLDIRPGTAVQEKQRLLDLVQKRQEAKQRRMDNGLTLPANQIAS